ADAEDTLATQTERLQLEKHLGDFMFKSTERLKGLRTKPNRILAHLLLLLGTQTQPTTRKDKTNKYGTTTYYEQTGSSVDGEQDDAMESGDISILNSWVGQVHESRNAFHLQSLECYAVGRARRWFCSVFNMEQDLGHGGSKKKIRDEIQRRKWDPGIKIFFRYHLEGKVIVKEWGMIRPWKGSCFIIGVIL
ncbi:hypothetical protein Tco_1396668, partial [Tanacetum coccineum]